MRMLMWGVTLGVMLGWAAEARAWGMATHILMVEQATGKRNPEQNLGSMMTDMNQAAALDAELRHAIGTLTHFEFDRLRPSCFARGFASHNNVWGADWYSHQYWLEDVPESEWYYPTHKIYELAEELDITLNEAEYYFEMAMEILLRRDTGPELGYQILFATLAFDDTHRRDLIDAFAEPLAARMPGMSVAEATRTLNLSMRSFHRMLQVYGNAYVQGELELARLLVAVGVFYLNVRPMEVAYNLRYAVEWCSADYREELDRISDVLTPLLVAAYPVVSCDDDTPWGCTPGEGESSPASLAPLLVLSLLLRPVPPRWKRA